MSKGEGKEIIFVAETATENAEETARQAAGQLAGVAIPNGEGTVGQKMRVQPKKSWIPVLFILPALAFLILFNYVPMYGILIAFQDYIPGDDFLSKYTIWIGWQNFEMFFNAPNFWQLMGNTFFLNLLGFVLGFPLPIIVALLLNSSVNKTMSKVMQTIFIAPNFISLVVMVGILYLFFGSDGFVNNIAQLMGLNTYSYFLEPEAFRWLYTLSGVWQGFGWAAIIYLAALSGVDPTLHEAAVIDGASRFRRILSVDFPAIAGTVSIQLILAIGGLLASGHEKALLMQTEANLKTSEIIATYVYKRGLTGYTQPGYATAIGLFSSLINVVLLVGANFLARRFSTSTLW